MTDTFYYCQFCETNGEGSHECPEQAWSAAMGRFDMETCGWAVGAIMRPTEFGDWVPWDEARALLHEKEAEVKRLRSALADIASKAGPPVDIAKRALLRRT